MPNFIKYTVILILFGLLVLIRMFENDLFYDPYLTFFQNDYLYIDSPRREVLKLTAYTTLRYWLNSIISITILFMVFKDKSILKFSAVLYGFSFIILLIIYLYFITNPNQESYYMFFNVRRFLIQPILLILLLPAFYYYKLKKQPLIIL
jgi:exosortase F-associated protein